MRPSFVMVNVTRDTSAGGPTLSATPGALTTVAPSWRASRLRGGSLRCQRLTEGGERAPPRRGCGKRRRPAGQCHQTSCRVLNGRRGLWLGSTRVVAGRIHDWGTKETKPTAEPPLATLALLSLTKQRAHANFGKTVLRTQLSKEIVS